MVVKLWEPTTIHLGEPTDIKTWANVGSAAGGVFLGEFMSAFLKQLTGKTVGWVAFALGVIAKLLTAFLLDRVMPAIKLAEYKGAAIFGALLSIVTDVVKLIYPGGGTKAGYLAASSLKSWAMGVKGLVSAPSPGEAVPVATAAPAASVLIE